MKINGLIVLIGFIFVNRVVSSPDTTTTAIAVLNNTFNQTTSDLSTTTTNFGSPTQYPVMLVLVSIVFSLL